MSFSSARSGLASTVSTLSYPDFLTHLNLNLTPRPVSDSLQHAPEKSTLLATYKRLVVGVAILSSPQEPYITYLAVRAGWDGAQIATYVSPSFIFIFAPLYEG